MNRLLIFALCTALFVVNAMPIRKDNSREDAGAPFNQGELDLNHDDRVFDAESAQKALLRFTDLQVLPMMKKSIAIGRAGFRPGKRTVIDISEF